MAERRGSISPIESGSSAENDSGSQSAAIGNNYLSRLSSTFARSRKASAEVGSQLSRWTARPKVRKWFRYSAEVLPLLGVAGSIVPVAYLLAQAPQFSKALASQGCLPDGSFALPGNSSIWTKSHFFDINVPVTSKSKQLSFGAVKGIDIAWDLAVGRGFQLLLAKLALHTFCRVLLRLMEKEEIPFRTYIGVSFAAGQFTSVFSLLAGMFGQRKSSTYAGSEASHGKEGRNIFQLFLKSRLLMLAMALLTLYIISVPTILSAMTGYTPSTLPTLYWFPSPSAWSLQIDASKVDCLNNALGDNILGLVPAWGVTLDAIRINKVIGQDPVLSPDERYYHDVQVIPYPPNGHFNGSHVGRIVTYYQNYKHLYDRMASDPACAHANSTAECPATNVSSKLFVDYMTYNVSAPLLNIQLFKPFIDDPFTKTYFPSAGNQPDAWACGGELMLTRDFYLDTFGSINVTGVCTTGGGVDLNYHSNFQWGFAFYPLFLFSCLQLAAAAGLCALWLWARRHAAGSPRARKGWVSTLQAVLDVAHALGDAHGAAALREAEPGAVKRRVLQRRATGMRVEVAEECPERGSKRQWSWATGVDGARKTPDRPVAQSLAPQ